MAPKETPSNIILWVVNLGHDIIDADLMYLFQNFDPLDRVMTYTSRLCGYIHLDWMDFYCFFMIICPWQRNSTNNYNETIKIHLNHSKKNHQLSKFDPKRIAMKEGSLEHVLSFVRVVNVSKINKSEPIRHICGYAIYEANVLEQRHYSNIGNVKGNITDRHIVSWCVSRCH